MIKLSSLFLIFLGSLVFADECRIFKGEGMMAIEPISCTTIKTKGKDLVKETLKLNCGYYRNASPDFFYGRGYGEYTVQSKGVVKHFKVSPRMIGTHEGINGIEGNNNFPYTKDELIKMAADVGINPAMVKTVVSFTSDKKNQSNIVVLKDLQGEVLIKANATIDKRKKKLIKCI